jgi:hypothetical protein
MILLVPTAFAGLLDGLSPAERQVAICQQAAEPFEAGHDYTKAAGVWEACVAECQRTGVTDAVGPLQDQLTLSRAMAAAAAWRTDDPNRYALAVLDVAADLKTSRFPGTGVRDVFRAWMQTEPGKARLDPVRTVTIQWQDLPADQAALAHHAADVLRRDVEDLGLKWAEPGKPEVDTILFASLDVGDAVAITTGAQGSLPRAQARLVVDRVRFRTLDDAGEGFTAGAAAEAADAETARDEALRAACQRAADRVLKQVLQIVFR